MITPVPALISAEETFISRCQEIDRFLQMLQFLQDNRDSRLCSAPASLDNQNIYLVGRDLEKTLRASAYLMLYNLVESTMTHAIYAIHQHIAYEKVSFDDLQENLKKVAIKGLRKEFSSGVAQKIFKSNTPISNSLIWIGFDKKEELFSGNIDARLIKDTAKEYGFQIADHDKASSRDGSRLLNVKTKRNELAHGSISFEDCGQDTSIEELKEIFSEIKTFIRAVLDGIHSHLVSKSYLCN